MTITLRFLCLFSSEEVRRGTFFAGRPGHWLTDIDAGGCEFVPLVLDHEVAALATSGLFSGATLLCRAADLDVPRAAAVQEAAAGFKGQRRTFELVASDGPVALLATLSVVAPALVPFCHQDGEVRPESPSWWRDRARRHLATGGHGDAAGTPGEGDGDPEAELRAFVARRRRAPPA